MLLPAPGNEANISLLMSIICIVRRLMPGRCTGNFHNYTYTSRVHDDIIIIVAAARNDDDVIMCS